MGVIVGSLFSYSAWMTGDPGWLSSGLLAGSIIFGLLIELFTTLVFKQPQQVSRAAAETELSRRAAA